MKHYPHHKSAMWLFLDTADQVRRRWQRLFYTIQEQLNASGNSNDGTTVMDFDPEEQRRNISINTSVAVVYTTTYLI